MKNLILFIATTFLLTACGATGSWYHNNKTQAAADRDMMECKQEAELALAGQGIISYAGHRGDLVSRCMNIRGYYQ